TKKHSQITKNTRSGSIKMKLTKQKLKQIIKEELKKVMSEDSYDIETGVAAMSPEEIKKQKMEDRIDRIVPEEQELARKVLAGEAGMGQLSPVAQGILLDII
ncbi:MAG: hypothetical protein QF858_02380, partial [Candidatus Pacebacteria bacterium]|nr:hypothetical protein [Candidatus Paceibacterota bacterium]